MNNHWRAVLVSLCMQLLTAWVLHARCTPQDCLIWTTLQVGHFHVNMKANAEVIAELESHGFIHDAEATRRLRAHTKLPWLSQTVMVFHKASQA